MLAPFTTQRVMPVDHDIGDGHVGRCSTKFQESFDKDSMDGSEETWQWDCMMNIDENMDDLKDYVRMSCILESWNPPKPWRHVSSLTMSNFDAYRHSLKEFQCCPIHFSTCGISGSWHWWWACWKTFHDISIEFRQRFCRWEWRMMAMTLHDKHWWKHGWSQRLCGHVKNSWALKPSHTMKACVFSNHVKFRCI